MVVTGPKVCSRLNADISVYTEPLIYSPLHLHPCLTPPPPRWRLIGWMCYYCSTGWVVSFSLCDVGSSGNCHPLHVTEVLSACWPRAFREQPAHPNRIGWARVIQPFPQRQINSYLHLWTLLILYDACVVPRHFTRGDGLHFANAGEWYKPQEGVLEKRDRLLQLTTRSPSIDKLSYSKILNEAQKACNLSPSSSHQTERGDRLTVTAFHF